MSESRARQAARAYLTDVELDAMDIEDFAHDWQVDPDELIKELVNAKVTLSWEDPAPLAIQGYGEFSTREYAEEFAERTALALPGTAIEVVPMSHGVFSVWAVWDD